MKAKLSITFGSIVGACMLHFVLASCTGNGDADAASSCAQWTTAYYVYDIATPGGHLTDIPVNQIIGKTAMPAGWEPVTVQYIGGGSNDLLNLVTLRQCAM